MKLSGSTAPAANVAPEVEALWRYLERLANAWEYASDRDLDVLDRMLAQLEHGMSSAGGGAPGVDAYLGVARRAVERARDTRADARMQQLENAREAAEVLRSRLAA